MSDARASRAAACLLSKRASERTKRRPRSRHARFCPPRLLTASGRRSEPTARAKPSLLLARSSRAANSLLPNAPRSVFIIFFFFLLSGRCARFVLFKCAAAADGLPLFAPLFPSFFPLPPIFDGVVVDTSFPPIASESPRLNPAFVLGAQSRARGVFLVYFLLPALYAHAYSFFSFARFAGVQSEKEITWVACEARERGNGHGLPACLLHGTSIRVGTRLGLASSKAGFTRPPQGKKEIEAGEKKENENGTGEGKDSPAPGT